MNTAWRGGSGGASSIRWIAVLLGGLALLYWGFPAGFLMYTGLDGGSMSYASSQRQSEVEFEQLASTLTYDVRLSRAEGVVKVQEEENGGPFAPFARRLKVDLLMNTRSFVTPTPFAHIGYFREAGIRQYEGPSTCLSCHEQMTVHTAGGSKKVDTMADVLGSVHYTFQQNDVGFSTYGYDGQEVNAKGRRSIPLGKINRACGIPGSFSWTGWAELIQSKPEGGAAEGVTRSEGCGQCHIGGGSHPATEAMLPIGRPSASAEQGIDCLICHAQKYDMNERYVLKQEGVRRWNQDRSLKAAMSVTLPTKENCLLCHQHNLGGDSFEGNEAAKSLGYKNPRILHEGAKRATPFAAETDVHAAAGMVCTDCHQPEGHKIPRGTRGTDLVANDLPGKTVACETCHTTAPHLSGEDRALLNGHGDFLACESCHIQHLTENNLVLRDWLHPVWDAKEGIFVPADLYQSGKPNQGMAFLWFNGNGTFLANALGDHPQGGDGYNPFMNQMVRLDNPEAVAAIRAYAVNLKIVYPDLDLETYVQEATNPLSQLTPEMLAERKKWVEEKMRPLMRMGKSKITPFKIFNALMYEDMTNQGPFGGMILPFDYQVYYEQGNPEAALKKALATPIIKRMYEKPFQIFMMDTFMHYFGVEKWSGIYPLKKDGTLQNVKPRWMRQMGTLMVNHSIQKEGRGCKQCHIKQNGILDFEALGYSPEREQALRVLPELQ